MTLLKIFLLSFLLIWTARVFGFPLFRKVSRSFEAMYLILIGMLYLTIVGIIKLFRGG